MSHRARTRAAFLLAFALTSVGPPAHAATDGPVVLGTAASFAVLAGSGITNTNATTITGDVGTFPTTTRTGFSSVTLNGTDHGGDAVTQGAKDDLVTAYDDAFGRMPATPHAVELGGSTLLPGVYTSGTFGLTGTLTLDAEGRSDAQFVFQAGTTLITEADSRVVLVNGASPCQIVWQVGSSATFKTGTEFAGDVLAYTSITAQSAATFAGRLLARNGAVTLDHNTISNAACDDTTEPSTEPSSESSATPSTETSATTSTSPAAVATIDAPPVNPANVAGPVIPAAPAIPAVTAGPGTPRRSAGGPPGLPVTGLAAWLAISGLALLVAGFAALAMGRKPVPARHRR